MIAGKRRPPKAAVATTPQMPVLTALQALNWIVYCTVPAGPDIDEAGIFNFAGSNEEYQKAERQLVAALVDELLIAEARHPDRNHSAGPLQIGQGPLVAVPSSVFRNPSVGISATGAICGRPQSDGGDISFYDGPFYAGAQFRTKDIAELWPPRAEGRAGKVSDSAVDEWMAAHFQRQKDQGKGPPKRDFAIADCIKATRSTNRQAGNAIRKVAPNLKRARGRHKE